MKKKEIKRKNHNHYDNFVRSGRAAMFTDDQIDWMWDEICIALLNRKAFLHKDNYSLAKK